MASMGETAGATAGLGEGVEESRGGVDLRSIRFELIVPDLRNGALANIQQAAVRAGMQALYYWPVIKDLAPERAVDAAEHSFRAHVASLSMGIGPNATAAEVADLRKWAVVLAGVRAGAQAAWRLRIGDVTVKEVIGSGMEMQGDKITMASAGSTATTKWAAARSVPEMTQVEMEALAMCAYMGMAIPVLQGASLVATGHHYVPSTYGLFKGLRKQALGSSSPDVGTWVESFGERFDDLAFHKACHPVSPDLKRSLAAMGEIANKLTASGHGSAAIRLPAIPSEASGGKAAIALIRSAERVIVDMGGTISANTGVQLMRDLEEAEVGSPRSAACDKVVAWVSEHERTLAFCAGIVQQIHDSTGTGKSTLLSAYSVKKLMAAHPSEVARGVTLARAASSRAREAMERGVYVVGVLEL
jgi:hypothetical protein